MGVDTGQTSRAVRGLTLGVMKAAARAREQRELEGLADIEENIKVDVHGRAEEFAVWTRLQIDFETVFIDASGQRDTEFDRPHFTFGGETIKGGPVALQACVTDWDINDRDEVVGCVLAIAATSTDLSRTFQGILHAKFQGYGMPADAYGGWAEQMDSE